MDAKDTIMTNLAQAVTSHPDLPMGQAIALEQAEISFKAGKQEGMREAIEAIRAYDKNYSNTDFGDNKFRESILWWSTEE